MQYQMIKSFIRTMNLSAQIQIVLMLPSIMQLALFPPPHPNGIFFLLLILPIHYRPLKRFCIIDTPAVLID
jgi:hypothetical protein